MSRMIKLLAALATGGGASVRAPAGFAALAAPMPTGILAWEVTQSKTMTATDPLSYSGNVQIDAKDSLRRSRSCSTWAASRSRSAAT